MSIEEIIKIPDLGGASSVDVIEILVKPGDLIEKDTSLITLESDKASMEIPSPRSGRVVALKIKIGDKVSQGDDLLILANEDQATIKNVPEINNVSEVDNSSQNIKKDRLQQLQMVLRAV